MAENPWTFQLQFSQSGSTLSLTWDNVEDSALTAPYSGGASTSTSTASALDGASATFIADSVASPDVTCNLQRNDTIVVNFGDSGAPPSTLTGTVTFVYSAVSGYTCADQLSASGGSYDTLPCTLSYTMTGSPD